METTEGDDFIVPQYPGKYLKSILPSDQKYGAGRGRGTRGQGALRRKRKKAQSY